MSRLAAALDHPDARPGEIVKTFQAYMEHGGHKVSRAEFEENLAAKLSDKDFIADIGPLLSIEYRWDLDDAADAVREQLIRQLT